MVKKSEDREKEERRKKGKGSVQKRFLKKSEQVNLQHTPRSNEEKRSTVHDKGSSTRPREGKETRQKKEGMVEKEQDIKKNALQKWKRRPNNPYKEKQKGVPGVTKNSNTRKDNSTI